MDRATRENVHDRRGNMTFSFLDTLCTALFVPATRPDRFDKAAASGADAVVIDLEDAVAPADKERARANLEGVSLPVPVIVRINPVGMMWHKDDLATMRALRPDAVMVPKAEAGERLSEILSALAPIPVIALVETALGAANARTIADMQGVARLAFGSIDYCADLDCDHDAAVLLPARSNLVLASRLAGLPAPMDGVTADTVDLTQTSADAHHARALGMGGKLLIHPAQVAPARRAFEPTQAQIKQARRILSAPEGVALLDGEMVDAPVRARAERVLARAEQMKSRN